jgi:hypothetical protein
VIGRPAAAEIVIVHRGQIVVNQAEGVDQLDCSGGSHCRPSGRRAVFPAARFPAFQDERGTESLPAGCQAVLNRFEQSVRCVGEAPVECREILSQGL